MNLTLDAIEAIPRGTFKLPAEAAGVPHVEQYFGPWAVRESVLRPMMAILSPSVLAAHIGVNNAKPAKKEAEKPGYYIDGGDVAVVQIVGTLTKYGSSLSTFPGTIRTRQILQRAIQDPAVRSVVLVIDSPGGTVAGVSDLAEKIRYVSVAGKPTVAFIEDQGASGAYWLASQADKVLANDTALVGSIGAYLTVEDSSAREAARGVTVHVVKTGPYKGAGEPGSPVTEEQLAHFQGLVSALNREFVGAIASGRGLSTEYVQALATGELWVGASALGVKLIDSVGSFDDAVELAQKLADERGPRPSGITEGALSVGRVAASVPATKTKASGRPTPPTAATKSKTPAGTARQSAPAKPSVSKEEAERRLADSVVRQIIIDKAAAVWRKNPEAQRMGSMQDWINVDLAAEGKPPMCGLEISRLNGATLARMENPAKTPPAETKPETPRERTIRESVVSYQQDPSARRLCTLRGWVDDSLRQAHEAFLTDAEAKGLNDKDRQAVIRESMARHGGLGLSAWNRVDADLLASGHGRLSLAEVDALGINEN